MPSRSTSRSADGALRLKIFSALVLLVVGLLGARLAQMQLIPSQREAFAEQAAGNAIRENLVKPARGYIYDRKGVLVVDNETTYDITVTPRYFDEENLPLLARLLGEPDSVVVERYEKAKRYSPYKTSVLLKAIPFEAFARVKEERYRLRGVGFEEGQRRRYHSPARMSHALGYVKEIDADELDRRREQGYRLGDMVGKTGLEDRYDAILRGRIGREVVMVNVHGMEVQRFERGGRDVAPASGYDLMLTIDAATQALAESLFVDKRGGAVMMDVETGGIISMVSAPDYDLDIFKDGLTQKEVDFIYRNPEQPQFNRATMAVSPPGSTWKPFMAAVALQEGMITPETKLTCNGGYVLGRLYRCHGGSHGQIAVRDAIRVSCNTFFFRLMNDTFVNERHPDGIRMDLEMWGNWAHRFGFGQLAPIDIPNQGTGLIPDSSYYDRVYPAGWGPGYTVNLGIGQGNMGTTPLQLARYTAAVANNGTLVTPHLVMAQIDPATGERREPARPRARKIPIEPRNFAVVRDGMTDVVEGAGTARRARIEEFGEFPKIPVAGKTGTAENPRGKDHSVFIAYAPADDPQVAVGIIVENIGYGGTTAAPIASLMIEQYMRGLTSRPDLIQFVRAQRSVGRI